MSDFKTTTSYLKCDNLRISGKSWPSHYDTDNSFLKYSERDGLTWERSFNSLDNNDTGLNDYIVMNPYIGASAETLKTNTNSYLRAGPGERTGGFDGKGTGITYEPKGQITIGLTE